MAKKVSRKLRRKFNNQYDAVGHANNVKTAEQMARDQYMHTLDDEAKAATSFFGNDAERLDEIERMRRLADETRMDLVKFNEDGKSLLKIYGNEQIKAIEDFNKMTRQRMLIACLGQLSQGASVNSVVSAIGMYAGMCLVDPEMHSYAKRTLGESVYGPILKHLTHDANGRLIQTAKSQRAYNKYIDLMTKAQNGVPYYTPESAALTWMKIDNEVRYRYTNVGKQPDPSDADIRNKALSNYVDSNLDSDHSQNVKYHLMAFRALDSDFSVVSTIDFSEDKVAAAWLQEFYVSAAIVADIDDGVINERMNDILDDDEKSEQLFNFMGKKFGLPKSAEDVYYSLDAKSRKDMVRTLWNDMPTYSKNCIVASPLVLGNDALSSNRMIDLAYESQAFLDYVIKSRDFNIENFGNALKNVAFDSERPYRKSKYMYDAKHELLHDSWENVIGNIKADKNTAEHTLETLLERQGGDLDPVESMAYCNQMLGRRLVDETLSREKLAKQLREQANMSGKLDCMTMLDIHSKLYATPGVSDMYTQLANGTVRLSGLTDLSAATMDVHGNIIEDNGSNGVKYWNGKFEQLQPNGEWAEWAGKFQVKTPYESSRELSYDISDKLFNTLLVDRKSQINSHLTYDKSPAAFARNINDYVALMDVVANASVALADKNVNSNDTAVTPSLSVKVNDVCDNNELAIDMIEGCNYLVQSAMHGGMSTDDCKKATVFGVGAAAVEFEANQIRDMYNKYPGADDIFNRMSIETYSLATIINQSVDGKKIVSDQDQRIARNYLALQYVDAFEKTMGESGQKVSQADKAAVFNMCNQAIDAYSNIIDETQKLTGYDEIGTFDALSKHLMTFDKYTSEKSRMELREASSEAAFAQLDEFATNFGDAATVYKMSCIVDKHMGEVLEYQRMDKDSDAVDYDYIYGNDRLFV